MATNRILPATPRFPSTRYQGSKRKLAAAIVRHANRWNYTSVLDAFGGTGAVAHAFKVAGKKVIYNDLLAFNQQIGLALIENDHRKLSEDELRWLLERHSDVGYGDTIERWFDGIYYPRDENRWLDMMVGNIRALGDRFAQALAWRALFQAALVKRPYNLFHRRNLYMRAARVPRSFGNKTTWDRPFDQHFLHFAREANAAVFAGSHPCTALRGDAAEVPTDVDLAYLDPPYTNARGLSVDYHHFYHFLEGIMDYDRWPQRIDPRSRHRRLVAEHHSWNRPDRVRDELIRLLDRFAAAHILVSYRSDGIPAIREITDWLKRAGRTCRVRRLSRAPYVLSTNAESANVLLMIERHPPNE